MADSVQLAMMKAVTVSKIRVQTQKQLQDFGVVFVEVMMETGNVKG